MAKRILIADDDEDIVRFATIRLKTLGYEILTAVDGQEALKLIRNEKPDLVLLDLQLPIIDGFEVCKRVKSSEELKYILVFLFTADGDCVVTERVRELGADDYIIKPFEPEELVEKIKTRIGQKQDVLCCSEEV